MSAKHIDQVTVSILVNNLFWIAEEMNVYLTKAAFSTNIKVRRDCSCALYNKDGDMIAQGEFIPVHLGIMSRSLKAALECIPAETLKDGDVIIHNDPYVMGSHLWDVMLFRPIFFQNRLVAFAGNLAHHVDIGGAPVTEGLQTVYEEGLRLPPVLLYRQGVLQEDIMRIIMNNVRTPYEVKGDIAAQTAANYRGAQRILELAEKFGADMLTEYFSIILDYSEKGMRSAIAAVPDGEASFADYVEHNGVEKRLTKVQVRLKVQGDELYVSFDGSGEPGAGGVNCPWALTHSAIYYACKAVLGSDIPTNQGAYRPIHLVRPDFETLVDAKPPHAVGMCTTNPAQRIVDAAIGAFAQLTPHRACACDGHWPSGRFVGIDPRTGRFSSYVETYGCGRGAKYNDDGADAHQTHMTNTANAPIEIIELEHPLRVESYALIPDSGGAGEYRGGVGLSRIITPQADMSVSTLGMRPDIQPYGMRGGSGGKTDYCMIEMQNGDVVSTSKYVGKGDVAVIRSSGGGGWGNPIRRSFVRIEQDVLDGYVTIEGAKTDYRVIIDPLTLRVDEAKTKTLRGV